MSMRVTAVCLALVAGGCVRLSSEAGLVAHWTFDEGSGKVARDVTGNGHDAVLTGTEWVASPRGHALRFDSKEDLAEYRNIDTMMLSGDLTLAAWVKTNVHVAPNTHRLIFGDVGYAVLRNGNLAVDSYNRLSFEWGNGKAATSILAPGTLMNGAWKHVVAVADSTAMRATLYVDGEKAAQMPMALPISRTAARRRITGWFYNGFFQGELDDIRLYSRALGEAEVRSLFRSQADVTVSSGEVALETFGEGLCGQATVTIRNLADEARRVEVERDGTKAQTLEIGPGDKAEVGVGMLPLVPVWNNREDLFVCGATAGTGKVVVTCGQDVQQVSLAPPATLEPLQVLLQDPWDAGMRPGRTRSLSLTVSLLLPAKQLRAGTLRVRLLSRETGDEVLRREIPAPGSTTPLRLDVRKLLWGAYGLVATFLDATGREILSTTRTATVLPGGEERIRVLNNLVSELMDAKARGVLGESRVEFMNPRQGWVWFRASGTCLVRLGRDSLLSAVAELPPVEAMRLLPAGRHVLEIDGVPSSLVVRAIPALVYNVYPSGPQIAPFGKNTWERLGRHTLANTNMIESHVVDTPEHREWLAQGKCWLANLQAPGLIDGKTWEFGELMELWLNPGKRAESALPRLSGMQIDEYFSGAKSARFLPALSRSLAELSERPEFAGKLWIPFLAGKYGASPDNLLLKTVLGCGWPFSEEVYLGEMPTEAGNAEQIRSRFRGVAEAYEAACPGSVRRMILTPMYAYLPHCTANRCPQADFRVHLDMQLQALATDPALFGLWGVQPYRSNYVDEEILNCSGMLLRHYCIEGRTDRMLGDPYELRHVADPDFAEGLAHWEVSAPEEGGVRAGSFAGYGGLEGRYPGGEMGDTFALMTRSAKAPNALRQELQGLGDGRLYSVKIYTADYADLKAGKSRRQVQPLRFTLEGADVLPGGFSYPFRSARGPQPFTRKEPFWMTYHWLRFRAKGPTAVLCISDWASPEDAGAPVGQQTMLNFVEVQPVLETAVSE